MYVCSLALSIWCLQHTSQRRRTRHGGTTHGSGPGGQIQLTIHWRALDSDRDQGADSPGSDKPSSRKALTFRISGGSSVPEHLAGMHGRMDSFKMGIRRNTSASSCLTAASLPLGAC